MSPPTCLPWVGGPASPHEGQTRVARPARGRGTSVSAPCQRASGSGSHRTPDHYSAS